MYIFIHTDINSFNHAYIHTYIHNAYTHKYIIHTYTRACIHTCINTYIIHNTYIHTYTHACMHTYIHIHTYIRTHTYIYIHTCIIHTYPHIYIHTYTYTHTHTHKHTHLHMIPLFSGQWLPQCIVLWSDWVDWYTEKLVGYVTSVLCTTHYSIVRRPICSQQTNILANVFFDQVFLVLFITANVCYHFSGDISLCLR